MRLRIGLALAALATAVLASAAPVHAEPVRAVATAGYTVADLERSLAFFRDALGLAAGEASERDDPLAGGRVRTARVLAGEESIELTQPLGRSPRPIPPDLRSDDLAFQHVAIVVADLDAAYARLRAHRVQHVSTGPQTLPESIPAAAGIRAFYFRDPEGHNLELIWYPPGKGDPRWQARPEGRLVLGLDHTAIAVDDTARSLAFWRDVLGLGVAGTSENAGTEQEHLNGVFGARVAITGLRAPRGPGVELLEYLAPPGGRPLPADLRPDDLLYWQITVESDDAGGLCRRLGAAPAAFEAKTWGYATACLVRDPDGHFVRIVGP